MTEKWKAVEGFEGLYEVSSLARVRSLDRVILARGRKVPYTQPGRVLRPGLGGEGYWTVSLWKDGEGRSFAVYWLVARAFVAGYFEGAMALHNDGVCTNCLPDNLRWGTRKENTEDAYKHGQLKRGEQRSDAVLTEVQVRRIRRLAGKVTQKGLAEIYGITQPAVSRIVNRKSWTHV